MSNRAPAYRDPVLYFDALRLFALREGDMIEETLATENEGKCLYVHLCTYTQPAQLFGCRGMLAAHFQPALRTGLMAPAWRPALCIWGVILDRALIFFSTYKFEGALPARRHVRKPPFKFKSCR